MATANRTSRPWRKDEIKLKPLPKSQGNSSPLIPESFIEVGQQRLIAVSIFALIQSFKLYDLLFRTSGSFMLKYTIIDTLFIWFLPVFRIPWLTFNYPSTIVQICLMTLFNVFLGSNAISLTALFVSVWKGMFERELSISGAKIRTKDLYDSSTHLSGRYTVHILPESTALLNPTGKSYCLGGSDSTVTIPIRLNATDPVFIELQRFDFETQEKTSFNFTKREIKKHMLEVAPESIEGSKLSYVSLPVTQPGLYRLGRVIDTSNMDVRLYRVDVIVPRCPSAYIVSGSSDSPYADRCIGDTDAPRLVVNGVPPMRVKYSRSIKGREAVFSVQSVQPENFVSPLVSGGLPESGYIYRGETKLDWAAAQTVEVDMDTTLGTTGEWMYSIDEIEDAFGNVIDYSKLYDSREDAKLMMSKSLSYGFMVHSRPQVHFKGCDAETPIKLAKGSTVGLPLYLTGSDANGPFTVTIERSSTQDGPEGTPEVFEHTFSGQSDRLVVKQPGIYRLKSINGRFCAGDVVESSSCLVYIPPEPTMDIDFSEINDPCAGTIGISSEITLTGTPPFRVAYRTLKDGNVIKTESVDIVQSRYHLDFRPEEAGEYSYEFFSLDDSLYKAQKLVGDSFRISQTVKALAGASFVEKNPRRRCCSGDTISLPVKLNGEGPFKIKYDIIQGGSKRTEYVEKDITAQTFEIVTPPLKYGGRYTVSLVSIEDGKGCKSLLNENDAVIDVRRQRPAAAFLPVDGSMSIRSLEGHTVGLPLRLSGEGPWDVVYQHVDSTTNEKINSTIKVSKANGDVIRVNKKGKYSLVDVRDAYCPGEIADTANSFDISWYDKPRMSIPDSKSLTARGENYFVRDSVCEGGEDVLEIGLEGAAPFSLFYDISGPVSKMNQHMQVATKFASIRMLTPKAGTYKYTFNKVADGIYDLSDMGQMKSIVVEQVVNKRPSSGFVNRGKVYKACVNADEDDPNLEPIPVQFSGKPPFSLTLALRSESTGKAEQFTIQNIQSTTYNLKRVYKNLSLGRHTLSIVQVHDGQGCSREILNDEENVSIIVADVPELATVSHKQDYCVGDRISFALTGLPPFEITYEFNGKKQKASTSSPFSRLASQPGNLTLISLSDSASSCAKDLKRKQLRIHPVPSVQVSEGISVVQDIHEGDQAELIFTFTGTPPFSFTYTRSEMVGRPPRPKVIETHSVTDVYDYEYSIFTSMQGIYEAIALQDAYCSVSNKH
ncbi:nucleoporin Pom152p [Trichomonascus vanleenenianus]|uniref:Pom152p n=1 Tax=Trichomonascus vanleenenianus TaxID=2268995 RepID=UPI003ECA52ED